MGRTADTPTEDENGRVWKVQKEVSGTRRTMYIAWNAKDQEFTGPHGSKQAARKKSERVNRDKLQPSRETLLAAGVHPDDLNVEEERPQAVGQGGFEIQAADENNGPQLAKTPMKASSSQAGIGEIEIIAETPSRPLPLGPVAETPKQKKAVFSRVIERLSSRSSSSSSAATTPGSASPTQRSSLASRFDKLEKLVRKSIKKTDRHASHVTETVQTATTNLSEKIDAEGEKRRAEHKQVQDGLEEVKQTQDEILEQGAETLVAVFEVQEAQHEHKLAEAKSKKAEAIEKAKRRKEKAEAQRHTDQTLEALSTSVASVKVAATETKEAALVGASAAVQTCEVVVASHKEMGQKVDTILKLLKDLPAALVSGLTEAAGDKRFQRELALFLECEAEAAPALAPAPLPRTRRTASAAPAAPAPVVRKTASRKAPAASASAAAPVAASRGSKKPAMLGRGLQQLVAKCKAALGKDQTVKSRLIVLQNDVPSTFQAAHEAGQLAEAAMAFLPIIEQLLDGSLKDGGLVPGAVVMAAVVAMSALLSEYGAPAFELAAPKLVPLLLKVTNLSCYANQLGGTVVELAVDVATAVPTPEVFRGVMAALPALNKPKGVVGAVDILTNLALPSSDLRGKIFALLGSRLLAHKESDVRAAATASLCELAVVSSADEERARAVASAKGSKVEKARLAKAIDEAIAAEAEAGTLAADALAAEPEADAEA